MTIKEVSQQYQIPEDTLRYYERVGMIPPVSRTPGGIRNYSQEDLNWVELCLCMRSAGLPVESIARYVRLSRMEEDTTLERHALLLEQREILREQQRQIGETLARLDRKIAWYENNMKQGTTS